MIYDYPESDVPILQGDIFAGLPRVDISLRNFVVVGADESTTEMRWSDVAATKDPVTAILPVRPVLAIVVTQDCDAVRSRDITLCEIRPFRELEGKSKETKAPLKWANIITQHARVNQKWFYLPPDERIGFTEKMGADFPSSIRLPRKELEELRHLRKGRLCPVAKAHFRERIGEFFRRYPYDEWYPLNREEFEAYEKEHPGSPSFPWQKQERTP